MYRFLCLLAVGVVGCNSGVECGEGTPFERSDDSYCFFRESIVIEGGFQCPASHPVRTDTPAGAVCSQTESSDPARDWPGDLCRVAGLDGCRSVEDAGAGDAGTDAGRGNRYRDLDEAREDGLVTYFPFEGGNVVEHASARSTIGTPGRYDSGESVGGLGPVFILDPGAGFFLPIDPTAGTQTFTVMFVLAPLDRQPSETTTIFRASKQSITDCGQQLYMRVFHDPALGQYRSLHNVSCPNSRAEVQVADALAEDPATGAVFVFYSFDGVEVATWLGGQYDAVRRPEDTPELGREFAAFYIGGACDGGTCDGTGPGAALLSFAMWSRVLSVDEMSELSVLSAEPVDPASLPEL